MKTLSQRILSAWQLCQHYRGQITGNTLLSRVVFAAWRIRTNLIRLYNMNLERQPIPVQLNQHGHSFDDDALIRVIAIIMNQTAHN